MLGFIEDYLASIVVVYLKGHTATAPCTHCRFIFCKNLGQSVLRTLHQYIHVLLHVGEVEIGQFYIENLVFHRKI